MSKLNSMPNIGKTLENKLNSIGINSGEELVKIGSKEAFIKIRANDTTSCLNMLCALEGAIQGIRWHNLDDSTKVDLKGFYELLK